MVKLFLITAALLLTACGSDAATSTAETADAETTSSTPAETTTTSQAPQDDDGGDADEPDDASDSRTVSALDDIPQVCRDLMAEFMRDIEPIVSPIDWSSATMADFESISAEFEARADRFDADSDATGECDDIDLESDESFDLLVQFAETEAPGTVGFFTFLDELLSSMGDVVSDLEDPTSDSGDGSLETCDDAIAFMEGLVSEYTSIEEVPVAQLASMADVATVIFTCTPEQAAFFESPEVSAFLDGAFG